MKVNYFFLVVLFLFGLTSCVPTYFQVYRAVPYDNLAIKKNAMVYEDDNCKVFYNLWNEGGNIGFVFYNKTDQNIYLNLEESFYIHNGLAYDYYKNRIFSSSISSETSSLIGTTTSKSVTGVNYSDLLQTNSYIATNTLDVVNISGYTVSYKEENIVCIPSQTSKIIAEYNINKSLIRDCELFKYPKKKQIYTTIYSKYSSPLVFSNRIAYTLGQSENLIKFENEFYVREITNYPENEMFEFKYDEFCGQKSKYKTEYFKYVSPDKFYIEYTKGTDFWKH